MRLILANILLLFMIFFWASGAPDPDINVNVNIKINGESASDSEGGSSNGLAHTEVVDEGIVPTTQPPTDPTPTQQITTVISNPAGCGGNYTSPNGTIRHPLFGSSYQNHEKCVWTITTGDPIKLTFVFFDLEFDYDYLYVRDGNSSDSPLLGVFTGSSFPRSVQANSGAAYLLFSSDGSVTQAGFVIQWRILDGSCDIPVDYWCDGWPDCLGGYDEANCTSCGTSSIHCKSEDMCVPNYYVCDNIENCPGGEDEANCPSCGTDFFNCESGSYYDYGYYYEDYDYYYEDGCIPNDWVCDSYPDCLDGEDEANCTSSSIYPTTTSTSFTPETTTGTVSSWTPEQPAVTTYGPGASAERSATNGLRMADVKSQFHKKMKKKNKMEAIKNRRNRMKIKK